MQFDARDRIERAKRFVHQEHRRIRRERARKPDALPLTSGELMRPPLGELLRPQTHQGQQRIDAGSYALVVPTEKPWNDPDVLRH